MTETKRSYNSAGDGWVYLTQLAAAHPSQPGERRSVPDVQIQEKLPGATVVRLSFRDGDVMADHHAPAPILVLGQRGKLRFSVGGEDLTLEPGTSVYVEAEKVHALYAEHGDAAITLVILSS